MKHTFKQDSFILGCSCSTPRMCDSEEIIHICVQIVRALVSYTCFLKLALPGRPQMIARFTQFIAG